MIKVAAHPKYFTLLPIVNDRITFGRDAICMSAIIKGTATIPLTTALHNKALIGSMPLKSNTTPSNVAIAINA